MLQQNVNTAGENVARIGQFLKAAPALAMTPEQMAQRIAAAGSAARREDQAALAKAGEDKARIMADLRAIAGSAWTRADQKKGAPQGLSYGQRQSEQMVNKGLSVAAKYIKFRGFVRLDELEVTGSPLVMFHPRSS